MRAARVARYALSAILIVVVLAVAALLVFTRTEFGRTRVRGLALNSLRSTVKGIVEIGRLEGNLLGEFSLSDVRITDSAGQPFISAERVRARVNATALLSKRVAISELTLIRPVIYLTKTPDEDWNYERIFASEGEGDESLGWGDWVALRNVTLVDGSFIMQRPWDTDSGVTGIKRERAVASALAGKTRTRVDQAPYGLRQTIDFRSINARMSSVLVADPASRDIVLQIDSLAMIAAPFQPPLIDVRRFAGEVRVGPDTVTSPQFTLHLPETRTEGSIRYVLATGDMFGTLKSDTLALADIRALYPALPENGGGRMDLTLAVRDTGASEYIVTNADLRTGGAELRGNMGLIVGDTTVSFRDTDLAFKNFPTALIERLAPEAKSPVAGDLTGRAAVSGTPEAMRLDANVLFDPVRHAAFRVTARGGVGFGGGLTARGLHVTGERVPVSILREFGPDPRLGGTANVDATLSGSTGSRLRGPYRLVHNDSGIISRIAGEGSIALDAGLRMDIGMRFEPVSLELAERFAPKTDFRGDVTGTGRLRGTPRDLAVRLDLIVPDSATVKVEGTYTTPNDEVPVYSATVTLDRLDIQRLIPASPTTTVAGVTTLEGRGTRLASIDAKLAANLQLFMIDSAEFRDVVVRAEARDGLATLDTLSAAATFGAVSATGTFGLTEGRDGTLRYNAAVTDLAGLTRWIATGDTGRVEARPLIAARLARMQQYRDSVRRDSLIRQDPAAQLLSAMRARPQPTTMPAPVVPPIPRDSIGGSLSATGEAQGNVKRFNMTSLLTTTGIVWGGNLVGAGSVNARWTDVATPNNSISAEGGVDSIRAAGFAFDSTRFKGTYSRGEGDIEVAVFPGDTAEYRLDAEYALRTGEGEVRLRSVRLRFDSTAWGSTHQSTISWRGQGITVDSLELRNAEGRGSGRIFINGEIPDVDPGRLEVVVDSLRLAPWLTLAQSNIAADGIASANVVWNGTRTAPRIFANLTVSQPRYKGAAFPEIAARFDYNDRSLTLDGRIRRTLDGELARVTGTVPIDLSLGDSVRTRLLEENPIALTIEGDSIPLSPIAEFTEEVTTIEGRARGRVVVSGTWKEPKFEGGLGLEAQRVGLAATGVTMTNVVGRVRMANDTLAIDSLGGMAEGHVRVNGAIILKELNRPVFDLSLGAERARILRNDKGSLIGDVNLQVLGPINGLSVAGSVLVRHGVIYIPDPERMDIINTEDPALFAVVDTATARQLDVAPPSEIMRNLSLDVDVEVRRGVFARSSEANIEVFGDVRVQINPTTNGKFAARGALFTDQGSYVFMGKRFVVTRGSVRFTGEPSPNPTLQVTASHEVQQAGRPPLAVRVVLGGTMRQPNVTLESDAQPPLPQSDLIALLAFGESSAALLQFSGSSLEGGSQAGSSLAGSIAALAQKQLASIALSGLVDAAEQDLATATRADVLNITPADLPADMSLGSLETLLRGTEVEIGKYADRHTFILGRVRLSLNIPGAQVDRRIGQRFTWRGILETRYLQQQPTLSEGLEPKAVQVLGTLLRMKFAW